jgi:hypothetical protein
MSIRRSHDDAVTVTEVVRSHPEQGVRNSQAEGIGRVAALNDLVAWNNLGRNVVFADSQFRPMGVFDGTAFPDDDELSQYDLDIHAIIELRGADLVVVLNHLGSLRAFQRSEIRRPGPIRRMQPLFTAFLAEDVERTVAAGTRLIGSRPRSERGGGLLVSEPIRERPSGPRLDADVALEGWGEVTALAELNLGGAELIVVGGEDQVALVPCADGKIGRPVWETDPGFRAASFAWDGRLIWTAGSERTAGAIDDYRWEELRGGGFAALDPSDGHAVVAGRLPDDVAWGNGGVAVVMLDRVLCAVGRTGRLHLVHSREAGKEQSTRPLATHSLGIAHAAVVGDRVLYGFNRGGYRLHAARLPS